jgi:siroheme synthase-like protein
MLVTETDNKIINTMAQTKESNQLFPVFLKLEEMQLLIVGGGHIGLEKLNSVLSNSPLTKVKLVAKAISEEIRTIAAQTPTIELVEKAFEKSDLDGVDVVISAIDDVVAR